MTDRISFDDQDLRLAEHVLSLMIQEGLGNIVPKAVLAKILFKVIASGETEPVMLTQKTLRILAWQGYLAN